MMSVFLMASSCRYHGTSVGGWLLSFADDLVVFSGSFDAIAACRIRHKPREYETTSTPACVLVDNALLVVRRFATMTDELLINMQQSKNTLSTLSWLARWLAFISVVVASAVQARKYSLQSSKEPSGVQWEAKSTCCTSTRVTLEADNTLLIGERCSAVRCGKWVSRQLLNGSPRGLFTVVELKVKM